MIILVDFENTHASGLEGYTYLNESDTLVMYYSDENSAVTKGVVDDLRKNGVHVRLVKLLKQHSNALDMYIASTTGMFLDSGEKICIVSKDHGYAAVRDFWHSLRGAEILLGETIKQCLLSSELNDEARIRLCKEREQKAMLVDTFTTMNTIPTRPTLSRSNQRRRRNDTRNFMEVSEPVAILPNPLMTETPADQLAKFFNALSATDEIPKTILYSLNPCDNTTINTIAGCFCKAPVKNRITQGAAWWFNDHKQGMIDQMVNMANLSALGNFNGMLTDSRSFLSYARHDYFRRILCELIGQWVENGEYPYDKKALTEIVKGISFNNAVKYFGFDLELC